MRQLEGICARIVDTAGGAEADLDKRVALCWDLYGQALRGMVLAVAGLSWHGRGYGLCLGPECEPLLAKAIGVLKYLRTRGSATKSAILQNCHLSKGQRDPILERLEAEGLVRVEGSTVTATTYPEFVRALYGRAEFPPVPNHWAEVERNRKPGKVSA